MIIVILLTIAIILTNIITMLILMIINRQHRQLRQLRQHRRRRRQEYNLSIVSELSASVSFGERPLTLKLWGSDREARRRNWFRLFCLVTVLDRTSLRNELIMFKNSNGFCQT